MDLYQELSEETGIVVTPDRAVARCVTETEDFRRIRDLKRRDWQSRPDLDEVVSLLTALMKTSKGEMTLKPVQAIALLEIYERLGGFLPIRVGGGKTLISLLIAYLLGTSIKGKPPRVPGIRPLLIVPAGLRDKTRSDMYALAKAWKIPPISMTSYELLSRDYGAIGKKQDSKELEDDPDDESPGKYLSKCGKILGGLQPNVIIADETHKLKNTRAGCTRKVRTYIQGARKAGKQVVFVGMTGTITSRSLRDYWHLVKWALGRNTPMPLEIEEFILWSMALDEGVNAESRTQPGALVRLSPDLAEVKCLGRDCGESYLITLDRCPKCGTDKDEIVVARSAYRDRFVSTPGIISTKEDRPGMSLNIRAIELEAPPKVREAILHMRQTWCTPDDHPFEQAVQLWGHCREAQCGFYYVWDPRPPAEWLETRKDWGAFVRETLKTSKTYHTPGHLVQAIDKGIYDDGGLLLRWRGIKDTFRPNTVPVWIDDTVLQYAANWLTKSHRLCWVEFKYLGEKLSELTGVPFFHAQGRDKRGKLVDDHVGPAIVSIDACKTGRNLQYRWYENLYLSPSSVPDDWEQSLGRTHRDGQPSDEVNADVLMMAAESYSSMVYAIRRAQYVEQTMATPQKLLYATRDLGQVESLINRRNDEMWKTEVGV